ncbi:MAG: Ferric siderophore transport system, periplasmic binding protein TonB [Myxococcales bacterium]|nr:Ferric siderophore transport system, periplasmic binding protein TonB [Myxococcales bacterium]
MRTLVASLAASALVHALLAIFARHAPPAAGPQKRAVPLVVRDHGKKPPAPPPAPKRIARLSPKRAPTPSAVEAPPRPVTPPAPPQGFSVDTKSTVQDSSVSVAAKEGGGNLFADPNEGKPAGDKAPVRPPPPEPFAAAEWATDAAERSPPYPSAALRAEIEGQVMLKVCVSPSGDVDSVQVIKGLGFGCDEAASTWAKQHWHFRPARRGGRAVTACMLQPMRFVLQR